MMIAKLCVFQGCRIYIALMLLASAEGHLSNPFAFILSTYKYHLLVSEIPLLLVAIMLPAIHCALVVGFFCKPEFKSTYILCGLLMLFYVVVQLWSMYKGIDIPFGCFSHYTSSKISKSTLIVPLSGFVSACCCYLTCFRKDFNNIRQKVSSGFDLVAVPSQN